jgi:hypothetical protein
VLQVGNLPPNAHHPALFIWVIFEIESLVYSRAGLDHEFPIYASHIAGMTGVNNNIQLLLIKMGSHELFLGLPLNQWPQATISISTFQVAIIMNMSHHTLRQYFIY